MLSLNLCKTENKAGPDSQTFLNYPRERKKKKIASLQPGGVTALGGCGTSTASPSCKLRKTVRKQIPFSATHKKHNKVLTTKFRIHLSQNVLSLGCYSRTFSVQDISQVHKTQATPVQGGSAQSHTFNSSIFVYLLNFSVEKGAGENFIINSTLLSKASTKELAEST